MMQKAFIALAYSIHAPSTTQMGFAVPSPPIIRKTGPPADVKGVIHKVSLSWRDNGIWINMRFLEFCGVGGGGGVAGSLHKDFLADKRAKIKMNK